MGAGIERHGRRFAATSFRISSNALPQNAPNRAQCNAMDEITIRPGRPGDARSIARLDVETWRATYAGILAAPFLVGLSAQRRELGWATVIDREPRDVRVAVNEEGHILGFGSCGRCRGEPDFTGEVFTLYVAPDWQNRGIGRRLLLALFERLVDQGCGSAIIWVLRDNPGRFFYQRLGGREIQRKLFAVGGKRVEASGYAWRDLPGFLATKARADRPPEP
jgi:ribosomal protein S18 acetylase RimI-like enzyme